MPLAETTETVPPINGEEQRIIIGDADTGEVANNSGLSTFFLILRLIIVLAAVAAAIYGTVFFLRKFSNRSVRQDPFVKVLASALLGANKAVHVVAVGSKAWLVGDTENGGVSLIAELTDQETIDAMLLEDSRRNAGNVKKSGFSSLLHREQGGSQSGTPFEAHEEDEKAEESAAFGGPTADRLRKTRERLQRLQ